jgi:hypothetical protein
MRIKVKNFWIPLIVATGLTGCSNFTEMKDVHVNNYATNNFIGNPCEFYIGDHCIIMKKYVRNPDNPYTK